jgi:hypothetical protein
MNPDTFLKIAYGFNIFILVPICWNMLVGRGVEAVFEGAVNESAGLRLMVASLWMAILAASTLGFIYPRFFAPVLLIQIFYKALWLMVFVMPLLLAGVDTKIPAGIAICFFLIVTTYPFLFWFGYMKV